jgi:hypothetical protein
MNTDWLSMDVAEALGRYFSESGRLVAPISRHHPAGSMLRDVAHYAGLGSSMFRDVARCAELGSIARSLLRYRPFALLSAPVLIGGVAVVVAIYLSQRADDNRSAPLEQARKP